MGRRVDYNPKMQESWTSVEINGMNGDPFHRLEVLKWCKETIPGRFTSGRRSSIQRSGFYQYVDEFRFKSKRDALLFKLTWGGNV